MRWGVPVLLLVGAVGLGAPERASFDDGLRPFLEAHCLSCHTGKKGKGDLDLERFDGDAAAAAAPEVWRAVRRRLVRREMPPEGGPTAAEYDAAVAWIDARFGRPEADPGRATIRRLNRTEYENTVRDLFGVDFDARALFPADEVGHGFDTIGDVLALPPALFEKYLLAAEQVARLAIVDEDWENPAVRRFDAGALAIAGNGNRRGDTAFLYSSGEVSASCTLPRDGEYVIRARCWGQQAGLETVRMAFRVDGRAEAHADVPATAKEPAVYEHRARLAGGERRIGVAFVNDYYNPRDPDPSQRDRNFAAEWIEVVGPIDAPVLPAAHRALVPERVPAERHDAALRRVIETLAPKAWRRPVTAEEVEGVRGAAARAAPEGASFEKRVQLAVTTLLASPHFLFRIERDRLDAGAWPVDDFELATRLSYFLWSSLPDDALFAAAAGGTLSSEAVLRAQVRRMLKDARASALARNFATQWLQVRGLDDARPDPALFPGVDDALLDAMREETVLYFDAVLREGRDVKELIEGDFTFVNEALAGHYGIPGVRGPAMRRVPVAAPRGGVLAHGSVLVSTSNPTRTSPVRRGKWILEALLDAPPPPPPPGADQFDDSEKARADASLRERMEVHRQDPNCAVCHARMDTLGFGLENFDAVGRWRDRDGPHPVDSDGVLPDGRRFAGAAGLKGILAAAAAFPRSLAKHRLVYAPGRGPGDGDEAALDTLVDALRKDPTLPRLIEEIVMLDAFRMRRAAEGEE